jgi:hypothetical protein
MAMFISAFRMCAGSAEDRKTGLDSKIDGNARVKRTRYHAVEVLKETT